MEVDVPAAMLRSRAGNAQSGKHRDGGSNSVSGLVSTLIPVLLAALVLFALFLILRKRLRRLYSPREYLGVLSQEQKTPTDSATGGKWYRFYFETKDTFVLYHHGLDAYFFLRFWKLAIMVCGLAWPLTWVILMPVYGTAHGGESQFDRISFSNIEVGIDSNRLYAVSIVAWLVFGTTMFLIGRETLFAIRLRHMYLNAPYSANRPSSRTVLYSNKKKKSFDHSEGGGHSDSQIKARWNIDDAGDLQDTVDERDKIAIKLETAMVKFSRKLEKKYQSSNGSIDADEQRKMRPTHRLHFHTAPKVDTIDWCQGQLADLNPKVETMQAEYLQRDKDHVWPSVAVEFSTRGEALQAFRAPTGEMKKSLEPRAMGPRPDDIIWKNMSIGRIQRKLRTLAVLAIIGVMILFWGPFTAVIGAIANINYLTNQVPFLGFIDDIPGVILGVVTGLLPTVLLALLMVLVPTIMKLLFKSVAGAATLPEVELRVQTWYFVFQVIQVFLITTLASGAAATVTNIIEQPSQAVYLLAKNLPKASNFYISYLVLYGVGTSAKELLGLVPLLMFVILGPLLDKTPRKKYNRYVGIRNLSWGKLYPKFTNLVVIALSYSCISPLILGFATLAFCLLFGAFRYQLLYSVDTQAVNTNGDAYIKGLLQMTTGVYLGEVCLIGLMAIATDKSNAATGPLVLMIVLTVATVAYHILLTRTLSYVDLKVAGPPTAAVAQDHPDADVDVSKQHDPWDNISNANGHKNSSTGGRAVSKVFSAMVSLLRVPGIEPLPPFMSVPPNDTSSEIQEQLHDAYTNPAATSPKPILWLVRGSTDATEEVKVGLSEVIEITDEGARWTNGKKAKLQVDFQHCEEEADEEKAIRKAPLWRNEPVY